ncbi:MAG: AAA family ATPase, partial [Chloroflexota bacterium]
MAKTRTSFVSQQCGATSPAYLGRCPGCSAWNSMVETVEERPSASSGSRSRTVAKPQPLNALGATQAERINVPIEELNRVLGGGLVRGTLVLVGGDPGIGKSTLVLQAAAAIAGTAGSVRYVSAEE